MSVISPYDTCSTCGSKADPGTSLRRCSRCRLALYCGTGCQNASWKIHKRICKPREITLSNPTEEVAGVRLLGGFNRPFYPSKTIVPPNHPVWTTGTISPLSQIVEVPLLLHRELEEQPLETPNVADKDNQAVTYLMIDPESGFASARWQRNIGPVTVVRADHKPLTPVALEMIWSYCDRVLDTFGDDPKKHPVHMYSKEAFDRFCQDYKDDYVQSGTRADEIGAQGLPL